MILISHRGNLSGKNELFENDPDYIDSAISQGYNVEIDVWKIDDMFFLGHDNPTYQVDIKWFIDRIEKLWIHCKNIDALLFFKNSSSEYNFFWHQTDVVTLTSLNYVWVFPGYQPISNSIAVLPELYNENIENCFGVCSDYIENYKKINI
jgi:hypothetical protein